MENKIEKYQKKITLFKRRLSCCTEKDVVKKWFYLDLISKYKKKIADLQLLQEWQQDYNKGVDR